LLEDVDGMAEDAQRDLVEWLRADRSAMRVIATSTRPLSELAADQRFSRELACLLSTITIELPPLSRRLEDLPLVAQAFLEKLNATSTKQLGGFSSEALDQLASYSWPDNLDELATLVVEAHERAQGGEVAARDLPDRIRWAAGAALHPPRVDEPIVLEEFLARLEKELIARALGRAKGNKSRAAKLLGLTRPRLYRRLVQLGMEQAEGKDRDLDS
jgi:DNA-binding NtrC family response regulator